MKVKLIQSNNKTVIIVKDRANGERFDPALAEKIFALEDQGYNFIFGNKDIKQKFYNFRVAFWRQFS